MIPERTIPRATVIGTLAATVVYISTTVAVMGAVLQGDLAASSSPFALAAGEMFGGGWDKVIALVAMAATFGALNGWIMRPGPGATRGGRGRVVPRPVRQVHGERRTPVFGLVVSSVLVSGLMLMNYTEGLVDAFTFIILLATLTTLVPYAYSAAAQAHLYLTGARAVRPPRLRARRRYRGDRVRVLGPRSPAPARTSSPRASSCSSRASRSTSR